MTPTPTSPTLADEQIAELERQLDAAGNEWLATHKRGPLQEAFEFKSQEYCRRLLNDVKHYRALPSPDASGEYARGRRDTLTECAKIADDLYGDGPSQEYDNGGTSNGWNLCTQAVRASILALADKAPGGEREAAIQSLAEAIHDPRKKAAQTEDEQGERWLNNAGEDVHCIDLPSAIPEAPRAETGEDMRHEKILVHKWLNPECIQNGCQSLIWKGRYESAVKGRADFRQAMKEARERIDAAVRAERKSCEFLLDRQAEIMMAKADEAERNGMETFAKSYEDRAKELRACSAAIRARTTRQRRSEG